MLPVPLVLIDDLDFKGGLAFLFLLGVNKVELGVLHQEPHELVAIRKAADVIAERRFDWVFDCERGEFIVIEFGFVLDDFFAQVHEALENVVDFFQQVDLFDFVDGLQFLDHFYDEGFQKYDKGLQSANVLRVEHQLVAFLELVLELLVRYAVRDFLVDLL